MKNVLTALWLWFQGTWLYEVRRDVYPTLVGCVAGPFIASLITSSPFAIGRFVFSASFAFIVISLTVYYLEAYHGITGWGKPNKARFFKD